MRRRPGPTDIVVVGILTVAVVLVGALGGDLTRSVAPGLALLLLLPSATLAALLLAPARHAPFARASWWILIRVGAVLTLAVLPLRSVPGLLPAGLPHHAASVFTVIGLVLLVLGICALELSRGSRHVFDLALDVVMVSASLLLLVGCIVARPLGAAGAFRGWEAVDVAGAAAAAVLVASLVSAAVTGHLSLRVAAWSSLAAACHTAALLLDLLAVGPDTTPPLGSYLLWAVAAGYAAVPLVGALRPRTEAERPVRAPRWNPVAAAVSCLVPIGIYVVETVTPPSGTVPDAYWIGGVLVLLCAGCMMRVGRSVGRAEVQSHLLEDLARSDHLTGLANRRTADAALQRAFEQALVDDQPVAVALCDLDHFKAFNDRFGHHAGDELLIGAGQAWSSTLGEGQTLARYGGEEFLVISSGLAPSALAEVVERMRRATPRGQSFSAGIAAWDGHEDVLRLVARADGALYEAKANGRARTCIAYSREAFEARL